MGREEAENSTVVHEILAQVSALESVRNSAFDDERETRRKLNAHGLSDNEIARQMATLRSNTANSTAVLTSYSLLHSLQHLDTIIDKSPPRSWSAEAIITLFRCTEVCIYNIGVLSAKLKTNVESGDMSRAVSNARWRAGFHEVLYKLSSLVVEVSDDAAPGPSLSIRSSKIYATYEAERSLLHEFLTREWPENDTDIFHKDLDDPKRFVFFSEFVNSSDERVWVSRLNSVRLPGAIRQPDDTDAAFYERTVCSTEMEAMMTALETGADTDLLSFRAIHQISEVIAVCINRHMCEVIVELVSPSSNRFDAALRKLVVANRMLTMVDDTIKLLMRALTPRSYKDIRPNLGMVRGTSSIVLRKTLFNTTYPLMVRAFKLRISDFSTVIADDDDAIHERAVAVLGARTEASPRYSEMMQQLVLFHQHVRTWRDNHQQLPKTHLGVSSTVGRPTVSLSGSGSAVDIAHELRKTHATDPIIPLYKAVMGTAPPDVHEMLTQGGFEEHMAHATARAVMSVYADVQERFYERTGKRS